MNDERTNKYCDVIVKVLDSQLAKLSDAATGSLPALANKLFEKQLIIEPVKDKPENLNILIKNFKACVRLCKTKTDIDTKLKLFLDVFREVGGPLETAADEIQSDIEKGLHEERLQSIPQPLPVRDFGGHSLQITSNPVSRFSTAADGNSKHPVIDHTQDTTLTSATEPDSYETKYEGAVQKENGHHSSARSAIVLPTINENEGSSKFTPTSIVNTSQHAVQLQQIHHNTEQVHSTLSGQQESVDSQTVGDSNSYHGQVSAGGNSSKVAGLPVYKHHHSYPDCSADAIALKERLEEKKDAIMELRQKVQKLEEEKNSSFQAERNRLDEDRQTHRLKLKDDEKIIEERMKKLNEEREQLRTERKEDDKEMKLKRQECEKELQNEKDKLKSEHKEKMKELEKQRKQQEAKIAAEKRKLDDFRKEMEKELQEKKFSLAKKEELNSKRAVDDEAKLTQERRRIVLKESEMKDLQLRLETKEKELQQQERNQREVNLEEKQKLWKEEERMDSKSQELKTKWEDYWSKEKKLSQKEKEIKKKVEFLMKLKQQSYRRHHAIIASLSFLLICTLAYIFFINTDFSDILF